MFKFINPHPQGLRVRDCVKRACCLASEINYHDIAIMLNRYRTESGGKHFNSTDNWKPFVENVLLGAKNKGDMQHEFYGHRYRVCDWAKYWDNSVCILRVSKHLVATRYGYYLDTWDSGDKGVYIAYFMPPYEKIVEHIKKNYPKLCKGLTLEREKICISL